MTAKLKRPFNCCSLRSPAISLEFVQHRPETLAEASAVVFWDTAIALDCKGARYRPLGGYEMNWDQAKGQWNVIKGSVRKQWGKLTDDDLDVIAGERDRLIGKIQERYGVNKEEAERQIAGWNPASAEVPQDYKRKAG